MQNIHTRFVYDEELKGGMQGYFISFTCQSTKVETVAVRVLMFACIYYLRASVGTKARFEGGRYLRPYVLDRAEEHIKYLKYHVEKAILKA